MYIYIYIYVYIFSFPLNYESVADWTVIMFLQRYKPNYHQYIFTLSLRLSSDS